MTRARGGSFDPAPTRRWLTAELTTGRLVGGAIEVLQNGTATFHSTFGSTGLGRDPVTAETQFWVASMTKPIVAAAALKLIESGTLSLTDPVEAFIPQFGSKGVLSKSGGTVPLERPATVLDLFNHTSGVTYGQFHDGAIGQLYSNANVYDFRATNAQMAMRLAELPLLHQPGLVFEYGMSTDLLGRVIEVCSGKPLDQALKTVVFDPLGMQDTGFSPNPDRVACFPDGWIRTEMAPRFDHTNTWYSGGAGLFSTISDYVAFTRALLGSAKLLRPKSVAMMRQDTLPASVRFGSYTQNLGITAPTVENGLGFGLGGAVRIRKTAHIPGGVGEILWPGISGTNFWVDYANDLIVVFMTHAPEYRADHRIALRQAIYEGLHQ